MGKKKKVEGNRLSRQKFSPKVKLKVFLSFILELVCGRGGIRTLDQGEMSPAQLPFFF
jgi:hypothetical protein